MKHVYIIHLTETDGDIAIKRIDSHEQLKQYVNRHRLTSYDFAIIKGGEYVKGFDKHMHIDFDGD